MLGGEKRVEGVGWGWGGRREVVQVGREGVGCILDALRNKKGDNFKTSVI